MMKDKYREKRAALRLIGGPYIPINWAAHGAASFLRTLLLYAKASLGT